MKLALRNLLLLGVMAEVLIFVVAYFMNPEELGEAFRISARWSGRLSLGVFLAAFYQFARNHPTPLKENTAAREWILLFAVVHIIHFGFLATNVFLNEIPLIPVKLAGGALAYLMVVAAPFWLHKLSFRPQLVYFYYVSLVMIITYVARVKGDFEGADPSFAHYVGMALMVSGVLVFSWWLYRKSAKDSEFT
ncbi:MAG: hypothetical protein AAFR61_07685 [Bacteroidota bacterium]